MVSEDRQRVIETNRSLRNIKNELEALLEKGVIDDEAFDTITGLLPAESSFNSRGTPAPRNTSLPTPASTPASTAVPTAAMAALSVGGNTNPPPSYAQSTGPSSGPPALPGRNPPPAAAPSKPIIAHARALYKYTAADSRDCSFDKDDRIAVFEYMNADWWMGRNQRTGQEGIFPRSYVAVEDEKAAQPAVLYPQQPAYGQPAQPAYGGGYPGAPPPGQPYQAQPPPGQPQGEEGGSKMGEHGKKFGKKLGNAAIFGAGATIGSNIVNSIF
ncbi:SH3 domain-containing protein [Triangularia verruculosa]|uniref:SH3 domain-containing protein n=1 Tax=Triangularia verruculosa TaxID=2587418 RepID=A0AAN6XFM3_9PEZI|nr:SH3 domain-containing protein [Triangularia verruculosa]